MLYEYVLEVERGIPTRNYERDAQRALRRAARDRTRRRRSTWRRRLKIK